MAALSPSTLKQPNSRKPNNQRRKREKEQSSQLPAASHQVDVVVAVPASVDVAAPVDVVTVTDPVVARQPAPAPRKMNTAPASLAQSLAETWNRANTRGWLRTDGNAGAFNAETISTIQYLADKYDLTPEHVVTQVVGGLYERPNYARAPAYLFSPNNKDQMGGFYREIVQERRLKKLEAAQAAVDDLQVAIEKNVPADILKNGRMKGDWLSQNPSRNGYIDVVGLAEQLKNLWR